MMNRISNYAFSFNLRRYVMGHSARSKFKREIRVQRMAMVAGTEKDQLQKDAVQVGAYTRHFFSST